jgi:type I restriction enzyme S subunit
MKEKKQYPTVQSAPLSRERGAGGECEKNAPRLRFPGFEGEWETHKIREIFSLKAGGDIDKEHVSNKKNDTFQYPIYANSEKDKGLYGYSDLHEIDTPCVTVAGRGVNIGLAFARNERFYPIVRLLVLVPKKPSDIHFFENAINRINIFVESTGVPQLTAPQLSSYKLAFPSLPEQQKIASFLTAIDARIGQLSRKKALLEQYKKGVMQQLFSQKIRFRDEEGKAFPEWEVKRLGEAFIEINEKNDGDNRHSIMTISARLGLVSQNEKFDRVIAGDSLKKYTLIKKGDFAYNKGNSKLYEMGCIYQLEESESALVPFVYMCFRPRRSVYRSFYKHWFLNHGLDRQLKKIITSGVRGDGLLNVGSKDFFRLKIPVPSFEEQKKIGDFLDAISSKIKKVEDQLTQTQTFKKGLLQQLFV